MEETEIGIQISESNIKTYTMRWYHFDNRKQKGYDKIAGNGERERSASRTEA